jgi:hypothetical protein
VVEEVDEPVQARPPIGIGGIGIGIGVGRGVMGDGPRRPGGYPNGPVRTPSNPSSRGGFHYR